MKSRAIALGASVIALTLAGGGQASAAGGSGLETKLETKAAQQVSGHTEATVNGPAGAVTVEGNVRLPSATLPSRQSHTGEAKTLDRPNATVEANRRSGPDRSEAFFAWDGRGPSLYVDHTRRGTLEVESQSKAHRHAAATTVNATARPRHAAASRRAHRAKAGIANRAERSRGAAEAFSAPGGHHRGLAPLRSIGREVGNPIALSLAGWMTLLFGGLCLGVGQLARRRRRFN